MNYFTLEEAAKLRFFKLPKALFFEEQYKSLSSEAKVMYGILLDRTSLSIKNGWVDKSGKIYCIYRLDKKICKDESNQTVEFNDEDDDNLVDLMGWSKPTVVKRLKELEQYDLLEIKRQGITKPNIMYLKQVKIDNPNNYYDESYRQNLKNFLSEEIRLRLAERLKVDSVSTDFKIINRLAKLEYEDRVDILSSVYNTSKQRIKNIFIVMDMGVEEGSIKSAINSVGYYKYLLKMIRA